MIDNFTLNSLLEYIPACDCDYQQWVNVGMALHKEGLPCSVWDAWSAKDTGRYHSGECDRKWKTFGYGTTQVTIGTLYHMAEENGWRPVMDDTPLGWDDMITYDGIDQDGWHGMDTVQTVPEEEPEYNCRRDIIDYLTMLFDNDEYVSYCNKAYQDSDGRYKPAGGINSRTCGELLASLEKHEKIDDTFGTPTENAGAWICFNPMNGEGRKNANVTAFRYALVECDNLDIDTQYSLIQDLKLPVKVLVHSGGKSLHAIVSVNACDYKQYQERVDYLYTICRKNGLSVDTQDKNPSRLSRFPGFKRGAKWQRIIAKNIGCNDWVEWQHYIEDDAVEPLKISNLGEIWDKMPPLKPELIKGVLRQGHKMILVSSSKAGKTFALIELAVSIAAGIPWFGFDCKRGPVLYLNMELDEASFDDRMKHVCEALYIKPESLSNIDIVHLRGQTEKLEKLIPRINRTLKAKQYAAVILDPIYKLGIGDENSADEVSKFCNAVDKLANNGTSVIYAHHHSKGSQGAKSSMDRASGSGVFARDADALVDMIELAIPDENKKLIDEEIGANATAWRMELTLREFARQDPVGIFFCYPLHTADSEGLLENARLAENDRAMENGREQGAIANAVKTISRIDYLKELIDRDIDFAGKRKSWQAYADEMKCSRKTIQRYAQKLFGNDAENDD